MTPPSSNDDDVAFVERPERTLPGRVLGGVDGVEQSSRGGIGGIDGRPEFTDPGLAEVLDEPLYGLAGVALCRCRALL